MAEISLNEAPGLQQIDISKLNLPQLTKLKKQLDQELTVFQDSLAVLKTAQNRFQESGLCLEKITPAATGKEILVPLTASMYVAGSLADTSNVLVDIGTGYCAQKSIADAKDYFKRKLNYVTEQMEKIQHIGLEKSKIRDATVEIMEMRIQSQMQKERAERA
ncbi:prefoldin subunit 5 [Prorops nasuta]|uniref:prefoldin subunit 5 n=1 Tax=Prorops nasuta TaxID=863751 RepID=UPI0034CE1C3E